MFLQLLVVSLGGGWCRCGVLTAAARGVPWANCLPAGAWSAFWNPRTIICAQVLTVRPLGPQDKAGCSAFPVTQNHSVGLRLSRSAVHRELASVSVIPTAALLSGGHCPHFTDGELKKKKESYRKIEIHGSRENCTLNTHVPSACVGTEPPTASRFMCFPHTSHQAILKRILAVISWHQ